MPSCATLMRLVLGNRRLEHVSNLSMREGVRSYPDVLARLVGRWMVMPSLQMRTHRRLQTGSGLVTARFHIQPSRRTTGATR